MVIEAIGASLEVTKQTILEMGRRGVEAVHWNLEQTLSSPEMTTTYEALNIPDVQLQPEGLNVELYNLKGKAVAEVPLAEKQLYDTIDLEMNQVNGRDILLRNDIDPNITDARGRTNMERMESGLSPLDGTGKEIELHHLRQNPDGCLAELTNAEHSGNYKLLHPDLDSPSAIDRTEFAKIRADHWKERAEMLKGGGM
ncbi:hypothetical protein HQN89_21870 [Paenibacillus frigoriresistens]|uniref:HNH/ENDO VII family nuclease n=1 Tax=Paenibacillus alginolyticus TaxID=59839 RepID=UPI001563EC53|nr:HNH/ENDO VII family nuclease [Paenibacillus frigoriresistens]NRF93595.1 hypothetical protein [Paenibacillus frigoriresistens]